MSERPAHTAGARGTGLPDFGRALGLMVSLALASPLTAGEAQDLLFATGVLDGVAAGQTLVFDRTRGGALDAAAVPVIEDGAIEVAVAASASGEREARVTQRDAGQARPLPPLPAGAGHPLLLVFLETTARNIAALTGGSPFYIRNRMREALAREDDVEAVDLTVDGAPAAGQLLSFRPFADDPNRARLGAFADLVLRITASGAVPGGFERFEAVAPADAGGTPAYSETIVFEAMTGG